MKEYPAIRLYRPKWQEYITIGEIASEYSIDDFYSMSLLKFVSECMTRSGGSLNPARCKEIYLELMKEAGL